MMSCCSRCCNPINCCRAVGSFLSPWKQELKHVLILFAITFLLVMPLACRHLHYSVFYKREEIKPAREKMIKDNDDRLEKADAFFANKQKLAHPLLNDRLDVTSFQGLDIIIGVITVSRNKGTITEYKPRFLTQALWKYLSLMEKNTNGLKVDLFVCNVEPQPEDYPEAQKMADYVPVVSKYLNTSAMIGNIIEKEKLDYVFCLNESLRAKPRHVLLVEDDAFPHDEILELLQYCLQNHIDQLHLHGSHKQLTNQLAYVKFYHPERVIGFISIEVERLPELFGLGSIFGAILTCIYANIFKKDKPGRLHILYFLFALYSMCVALAIGRPHLVALRFSSIYLTSYVPAPDCCTPAMLFPSVNAHKVVKYLSSVTCRFGYAKDFALKDFCTQYKLKPYLVQPNYFKHIGFVSSLRPGLLDPFIV